MTKTALPPSKSCGLRFERIATRPTAGGRRAPRGPGLRARPHRRHDPRAGRRRRPEADPRRRLPRGSGPGVASLLGSHGPPARLIVNPPPAAAAPRSCCPASRRRCAAHGFAFRVERTTSIEHARELAARRGDAGEVAAALGGDGLIGAVAGELRGTDGPLGSPPRRPRQRLRAQARHRRTTRSPRRRDRGRQGAADRRRARSAGARTWASPAPGFDSDVNEIANATRLPLGTLVYAYGALRALARGSPPTGR